MRVMISERNLLTVCAGSVPTERGEMPMSYTRSEFPADLSAFDLPVERSGPSVERLLFRKRSSRGRVLVAFSFGVAATRRRVPS